MTTTALNTFGSILTHAASLEQTMQAFYAEAKQHCSPTLSERLGEFERKAGKRRTKLTQIRQENVTEIVLEPIEGLNIADYTLPLSNPTTDAEILTVAVQLEQTMQRFYAETGPKLNVTEPRRAFAKFEAEYAERIKDLSQ
jgi:hypothetical protein